MGARKREGGARWRGIVVDFIRSLRVETRTKRRIRLTLSVATSYLLHIYTYSWCTGVTVANLALPFC